MVYANTNRDPLNQYQSNFLQAGGAIYGAGLASLFGVVFAYARNKLPGKNSKRKALFLAAVMWFVLYLIVALKYPNPPAVGDPETIYYREALYVGYIMISGFTALCLAVTWNRIQINSKMITIPLIYAAIMVAAYLVMPPNTDKIEISTDLIQTFRILSAITIGIFWGILGIIFGSLWDKFLSREQMMTARL